MISSSYFLHRDHITNIYHKYILQAITPVFYGIICDMKTRSGINIRKWCLAHEELIETRLAGETDADELADLFALHEKKLSWLMHERLVHLIVMCLTAVLVMFSMGLILFLPEMITLSGPLFLIAFILLIFYVRHYFFLENTTQQWYVLDEKLRTLAHSDSTCPPSSQTHP